MGCTSSSSAKVEESYPQNTPVRQQQQQGTRVFVGLPEESFEMQAAVAKKTSETIAQAYERLDEEICALESMCPGPRLLTAEAWIEHLETLFAKASATSELYHQQQQRDSKLIMDVRIGDVPNATGEASTPETVEQAASRSRDDTAKLALKLEIALDPTKAARQEEFIARVSRSAMELEAESFRVDMIEHARTRAINLRQTFTRLKTLYLEQDHLIASVNNGSYFSLNEQRLDEELEFAREIRDRLGGVSEQWRTAGLLIRASAKGLLQAVEYWKRVGRSTVATEKINLALDCRTACHGGLITLEAAQAALPQVEIPFVTLRQQSAVKHGLVYMLTDMANPARYRHTKNVLEGFQGNVEKSAGWLHDTYKESLGNDLSEADQAVMFIAKQLKEIRKSYISQRIGNKVYVKPSLANVDKR